MTKEFSCTIRLCGPCFNNKCDKHTSLLYYGAELFTVVKNCSTVQMTLIGLCLLNVYPLGQSITTLQANTLFLCHDFQPDVNKPNNI